MRVLFGAVLAFVFSSASTVDAAGSKLRLVNKLWGTGEVRVVTGRRERLLERYAKPIGVKATEISPDGRWAFVWYREARPPLQLAIYALRSMRRTARFMPGFGREMHFTPKGNIVHTWGCGTSCAMLALYDVHGKKLLGTGGSGVDVSPTRRFAMTGPSLYAADEPVVIYDIDTGRRVFTKVRPSDNPFVVNKVRWDDRRNVVSVELTHLHRNAVQNVTARLTCAYGFGVPSAIESFCACPGAIRPGPSHAVPSYLPMAIVTPCKVNLTERGSA